MRMTVASAAAEAIRSLDAPAAAAAECGTDVGKRRIEFVLAAREFGR